MRSCPFKVTLHKFCILLLESGTDPAINDSTVAEKSQTALVYNKILSGPSR